MALLTINLTTDLSLTGYLIQTILHSIDSGLGMILAFLLPVNGAGEP